MKEKRNYIVPFVTTVSLRQQLLESMSGPNQGWDDGGGGGRPRQSKLMDIDFDEDEEEENSQNRICDKGGFY